MNVTESDDQRLCDKFIRDNQDTLIPNSSYIVIDHGKVTAYKSFAEAYPFVRGRDDLFEHKYRGIHHDVNKHTIPIIIWCVFVMKLLCYPVIMHYHYDLYFDYIFLLYLMTEILLDTIMIVTFSGQDAIEICIIVFPFSITQIPGLKVWFIPLLALSVLISSSYYIIETLGVSVMETPQLNNQSFITRYLSLLMMKIFQCCEQCDENNHTLHGF